MSSPASKSRNRNISGSCGTCCAAALVSIIVAAIWIIATYISHNRPPNITIPTPIPPANNAFNDFIRAGNMARQISHKSPYSMAGPPEQVETFANFTACAQDMQPAHAVLKTALSEPYLYPPDRSFLSGLNFPNLALCRELARSLSGEARYYELAGDYARSMDTTLDGVQMAVTLPHGAGLMPSLTARAGESIMMSHIEPVIPKLSTSELAHAAARLAEIRTKRVSFSETVLEEEKATIAAWLEMLRSPDPRNNIMTYSSIRSLAGVEEDHIPPPSKAWKMARFALADKEVMLKELQEYFESLSKEAKQPYTGKSSAKLPDNLIAEMSNTVGDDLARQRAEYGNAQFLLIELEVALYRYRMSHGRFPHRLSDLVPALITRLPDDPFAGSAGKSFVYRSEENSRSFLLYSLGPDLNNDGGLITQKPWQDRPSDIVAGHLFPKNKKR